MSVLQADDLSAIRLVMVPDTGPPFDGDPLAAAAVADAAKAFGWRRVTQGIEAGFGDLAAAGESAEGGANAWSQTKRQAGMAGPPQAAGEWPGQFARLLAEALAGARPMRQVLPWTSERARVHLRGLAPLFSGGQRPRVLRVVMTRPTREVIEMTVVVGVGARTRALAVRLEQTAPRRVAGPGHAALGATEAASTPALRWICTDVEAA